MAQNSFKTQSKVDKAIYFGWKEQAGIADKIDWRSDEFSPVNNLGNTISLRRPSDLSVYQGSLGVDESLPGVTQPTAGYQVHTEPFVPLTITKRFEVNLQYSLEDITLNLTADQAYDRAIGPGMKTYVDLVNQYLIDVATKASGQYVAGASGPATASTGAEMQKNVYAANSLLEARGVSVSPGARSIILNPNAVPNFASANATTFHSPMAEATAKSGKLGMYAGFDMYSSGLLVPSTMNSTATVDITAITLPTVWAESFTFTATIGTAILKAGTRITFANGGTTVNTVNRSTKADTGNAFVGIVQSDVAIGAGQLVTVKEVAIATGAYQNITAAIDADSTVTVINTNNARPGLAFEHNALVGASPIVKLPAGVKGRNINIDGINIALVEDHWSGTLQSITKLVGFVGITAIKPEAIVAIY